MQDHAASTHRIPFTAAFKSWSSPYIHVDQGVLEAFDAHITATPRQLRATIRRLYARLIALIQSSGTGKSRLMDEKAKRILQITVNLRDTENGMPLSYLASFTYCALTLWAI